MATTNIQAIAVCGGGNHATVRVTMNGNTFDFVYDVPEITAPIASEERREVILALIRFHCFNMTGAQARAELQQGIDVVTS